MTEATPAVRTISTCKACPYYRQERDMNCTRTRCSLAGEDIPWASLAIPEWCPLRSTSITLTLDPACK